MAAPDDTVIKTPFFGYPGKGHRSIARSGNDSVGLKILGVFIFGITDGSFQRVEKEIFVVTVFFTKHNLFFLAIAAFMNGKGKGFCQWIRGNDFDVIFFGK